MGLQLHTSHDAEPPCSILIDLGLLLITWRMTTHGIIIQLVEKPAKDGLLYYGAPWTPFWRKHSVLKGV